MNTPDNIIPILRKRDKNIGGICLLYVTMFAVIMTVGSHEVPYVLSVLFGAFMFYAVVRSFAVGWQSSNLNRWIQENAFEKPPHLKKSVWLLRIISIYFSIWAAICYVTITMVPFNDVDESLTVFILRLVLTIGIPLGLGIIAFLAMMPIVTGEHCLESSLKENYAYMCYKRDRMLAFQCFFVGIMILVLGGYWYAYFQGSITPNASFSLTYIVFPFVYLSLKTKFIQEFSKMHKEHLKGVSVGKFEKKLWVGVILLFLAFLIPSTGAIVYAVYELFTTQVMNSLLWFTGLVGALVVVTFMYVLQLYSPLTAEKSESSKRLA